MSKKSPIVKPSDDPRVVAERLLRQVLPEAMYEELAATGQCSCVVNEHEYTFSRKAKTKVGKDGKTFSCCIEHTDNSIPRPDRLVSEYLLVLNDEEKYLATANLTQIGDWSSEGVETGQYFRDALVYGLQMETIRLQPRPAWIAVDPAVRGRDITAIQVDRGPWRTNIIPPMICAEAAALLDDQLRGFRFTEVPMSVQPQVTAFGVTLHSAHHDRLLRVDDFSRRLIYPAVREISHWIGNQQNRLYGVVQLPIFPHALACVRHQSAVTNLSLRYLEEDDMAADQIRGRFDIGLVLHP